MKILLVNIPSRRYDRTPPLGLFYVAGIIDRIGHQVKIFDPYLKDASLESFTSDIIDEEIKSFGPDIIGYGGIVTSYGKTKLLSNHVKKKFPEIIQIAGGPLASSYDLLLGKASIDVVFHGECESSLPAWFDVLGNRTSWDSIKGISFFQNSRPIINKEPVQIKNLDDIPFPPYGTKVDYTPYINRTIPSRLSIIARMTADYPAVMENLLNRTSCNPAYVEFITKRGCTHRCFFCYRHVKGIRSHSVEYVIEHMKRLKSLYGIGGFYFADELFNHSKEWVMNLCENIKRQFPDIFYIVCGARVDTMDIEILDALYMSGCIEIDYGQESGDNSILKEYGKGTTAEKNFEITRTRLEKGIFSPVQLVIGSPSENPDTIKQTIKFLKKLKVYGASINYLLPLPETPSWEFVHKRKLINDVEKYLEDVVEYGGGKLYVNLTGYPKKVVSTWVPVIHMHLNAYYWRRRKRWILFMYENFRCFLLYRMPDVYKFVASIKKKLRNCLKHSVKLYEKY